MLSLCLGQNTVEYLEAQLDQEKSFLKQVDLLNELSLATLRTSSDSSITYARMAITLADSIKYLQGESVALRRLGQNQRRAGHHEEALTLFEEALLVLDNHPIPGETARAYAEMGRTLAALSRTSEAINISKSALTIFSDLEADSAMGQLLNEIGFRYWSIDEFDSALVYLQGSLDKIKNTDRKIMKARLINNIGAIHYKIGNFDIGLSHYIQALKLQQELGNNYGVSLILSNIGKIYVNMGGNEDAMEKFQEALTYGMKSGDGGATGYAQNNIGELYQTTGLIDSAQAYVEAAYETYISANHIGGQINALNNLGSIYTTLGRDKEALSFLSRSYALSDSVNNVTGLSKSLSVMGDVYLYQKEYKRALEQYVSAVDLASRHSLRIQLQEDYGKIAELYDLTGDSFNALRYFRMFTSLKDSLISERVRDHLNALRIQYATVEKEEENRQLVALHEQQKLTIAKRTFILTITSITTATVVILFLFLFRALAKLKKANRAISSSEEKYRLLVENVNDAIVISQSDKFIYFNSQFSRILGYEDEELLKRDYRDIYTQDGLEILNKRNLIRETGEIAPARYETVFKKQDGTIIQVEANVTVIEYKGKQATFAVIRDITERKQSEQQQLFLEKQLQQARKLESMGTMIGGIAHEFNNILQSLFVYSELINEDLAEHPEIKTNFNMVEKGIKRAGELVKQILSFSRKTDLNLRPNLLQKILPEATSFIRASLPSNISIESVFQSSCVPVNCDTTQIHQLLLNLSNNASRAMHSSKGVLGIYLNDLESNELSGNDKESIVELIVSDNGHGMDAEILEKVFDPFYTTQAVGEGTGLGLSVVYGIVQQMRGTISVTSELEKGTTFRILFPAATEVVGSYGTVDETPNTNEIASLSVLLVDDELDIRQAGTSLLEAKGCTVTTASNGSEAMKILHAREVVFDLIITDLTMPQMTGLEMVDSIRKEGYTIPVILSSGVLDQDIQETYMNQGINGFIAKPWTGEQLMTCINQLNLN